MERTSSERPEPRSPVSPITSPLLILRSNGLIVPLCPSPLASITGVSEKAFLSLWSPLISARSSKSLPIIFATSITRGRSFVSYSPTSSPFRRTVILSQTAYTCSRKWVTKIIPTPSPRSLRISTNSFSTSSSSREEVGSSRIRTLHFISTARAIAIICWIATEHSSSIWVGGTLMFRLSRSFAERAFISFQLIIPSLLRGSRPINRFSATVRFGQRFTSWYTVLMPLACASCGEWLIISLFSPFIWMEPLSNSCTPVRTLISVDFPAPFSPISAWTSPLRSVKSTWERARTPVKFLLISHISKTIFCSIFFPPFPYFSLIFPVFERKRGVAHKIHLIWILFHAPGSLLINLFQFAVLCLKD